MSSLNQIKLILSFISKGMSTVFSSLCIKYSYTSSVIGLQSTVAKLEFESQLTNSLY
ncbi:hypothetical protein Sjap_020129 [Stephania japonica]|uniref:Uncharacterized protein n=1 Tax=Stephania japonica TaxID=461633 RepID=A0AAP0F2U1_9MAGN